MAVQTEIALDRQFDIPRAVSVYPQIGRAYLKPAHSVSISPRVIRTDKNYYDSQKVLAEMIERGELPSDARFMSQAKGRGIERSYLMQGKDPRKADEFKDHFGKNENNWYAWELTSTGLRVPKGWENGRVDNGTGKYPRIVLEGDKKVGELQVPVGNGRVIVEYDDVFGIPIETREIAWPHTGYYSHFWLNQNPILDEISGHYDVAVGRRGAWHHAEGGRCLYVSADSGRFDAPSHAGFRPVRGSVPEIEIVSSNVDVEQIRQKILEKARAEFVKDVNSLSAPKLAKKYQL